MGEHTSKPRVAGEQGRSTLGALIHAVMREAIERADRRDGAVAATGHRGDEYRPTGRADDRDARRLSLSHAWPRLGR